MIGNKTNTAGDLGSIHVMHDHEAREWATKLGVSVEELRASVAAVGTSAAAVREHLERSADVQLSESGAVLGRPDRKYGAYGLVKGKAGGETPSA